MEVVPAVVVVEVAPVVPEKIVEPAAIETAKFGCGPCMQRYGCGGYKSASEAGMAPWMHKYQGALKKKKRPSRRAASKKKRSSGSHSRKGKSKRVAHKGSASKRPHHSRRASHKRRW